MPQYSQYSQYNKNKYAKKYYKKKANKGQKSKHYYKYKANKAILDDANQNERRARGPGFISKAGEVIGAGIGTFLGGPAGGVTGFGLGGQAGQLIEQITGFGAYKINNNSLMKGGMTVPQVVNRMGKGGTVVRHREYIQDINASINFSNLTLALNPGLASSFPWLSQIAGAYDEYQWEGMIFEFKSLSSDSILSASSSTSLGSVCMATQYNALAPPFTDKRSMENYEFGCSEKPSVSFIHPIECKASVTPLTKLYVRTGAIAAGSDQRLYDLGEFNIATQGMQAATGVVGELWVSYQVCLYKEKFNPTVGTDHFFVAGYTNAAPLGTPALANASAITNGSSLGCTIATNGGGGQDIKFPPNISNGTYLINMSFFGTAQVLVYPTLGTTNITLKNFLAGDGSASLSSPAPISSVIAFMQITLQVTGQGAILTVGGAGTLPSAGTKTETWITMISPSIVG